MRAQKSHNIFTYVILSHACFKITGEYVCVFCTNQGVGWEITPWTGDADLGVQQDKYDSILNTLRHVRTVHGIGFKFAQSAGNFGRGCHNVQVRVKMM